MTREEAIKLLEKEKEYMISHGGDLQADALGMAINALEQEPSDDEVTITMKRGTLKCSNQGYVIYNKDWFRKHFATEVMVMTGYDGYSKQPTSDDCVSRQAVLEVLKNNRYRFNISQEGYCEGKVLWSENLIKDDAYKEIEQLPSITPTRKKGKWIKEYVGCMYDVCSECRQKIVSGYFEFNYCPNCGAEMESEE